MSDKNSNFLMQTQYIQINFDCKTRKLNIEYLGQNSPTTLCKML